ncbi:unnamed protein product [Paramecium sonneborni]|uniref:USP domain-containing protein n=1 Tax=Paramecium sonneborni TaxID=65129 RepID=A0A8S1PBX3_9CILI|nr:unnamed protein product [Paramecium sonneborni]
MIVDEAIILIEEIEQPMIQEAFLSQEYEMPGNKSSRMVIFPPHFYFGLEDKRNALNYIAHAKDGIEFNIQIGFEIKDEKASILVICNSLNANLDQSKIYKLSSTIFFKKTKKQKDVKLETKEIILRIPLTQKQKDVQLCLMNEILIEVAPKYNSRDEVGFTGIINNAATCYMNSVFQILFNLGIVQKLVYSIESDQHNQFPCTLQSLFYNLKHSKIAISTQEIIKSFKWDVDQQAIQQDVQEFIMELLKALGTKAPQIENEINFFFQGILENHIKNEYFDNKNQEQFMDIQLNITNSLKESLDLFVEYEPLDSYIHEELGSQEAIKFHKFKKLPPILLINLKRYQFDGQGFTKNHDSFQYDNLINFKNYLIDEQDKFYELYAVLVHRGEAINHGHYYCYIKPFFKSLQWFKFDDKFVTRATQKEVFQNNFGGQYQLPEYNDDLGEVIVENKNNPETAYMLVYLESNNPNLLSFPENYPEWILKQEQKINDLQFEQKNYISTYLFSINHLNINYNSQIKLGIIFHRQASNQSIELNAIEAFFDQYTTPLIIPKIITVQQIIDQLCEKININKNNAHLLIYRITQLKPNLESVILMQPQKLLTFYLANKYYQMALMLISTNPEDQQLINNYLSLDKIKLEQNICKSIKEQKIIENKIIIFMKTVNNLVVLFQQVLILNKDENIEDHINNLFNQDLKVNILYQNDSMQIKQSSKFKNTEYYQAYLDYDFKFWSKIFEIENMKEVLIRVVNENHYISQLFNKEDSTQKLLEYLAQLEDCHPDNIQIKYKDKKGNYQILQQQQIKIDEITQYDNNITYKQTVIPVGAMKEQISFQVGNQTYIIQKSMNFMEFMEQENLKETLPLLISKKDQKAAWVLLDHNAKISKTISKYNIRFMKPLILGNDIYVICFLQSVEIILLCNPLLLNISKTCTIAEITNFIIENLSQNPITYKTQQILITQDAIYSTEDQKTQTFDLQLRIKINNEEVSQNISVQVGSLISEEKQITLIITFLTIRDTKNDKLRQKGVQIL